MQLNNELTAALMAALHNFAGLNFNPVKSEYFNPEMVSKGMNIAVLHKGLLLHDYLDVTKKTPSVAPSSVVALEYEGVRWFWVVYKNGNKGATSLFVDYLFVNEYIATRPKA